MLLEEVSFLLLLCLSAAADQTTVKPGDDATLQCHCPNDAVVTLLEWTRLEQKSDSYVFFYRNNRLYEDYQDPSFRGRVELRDPEMKDGDVSVTLKNVTVNDTGTYKCQIISKTENGKVTKFSSLVSLNVTDSGPSDPLAEGNKDEGNKDEGNNGGGNEELV
ncbi:coxsackievirus and adenovirus receptor-like isoform X3 [Platichthys flesus]|nr:coxsackievirus and adenovirus receptor-like isoform X2 [Platichthys flesus]XP_062239603.1 coxsackievirus and adenovirus receptor-like isoform X3 [Platichthys flesus]